MTPRTGPDWIREHGDDLIPVKVIDLLSIVARLEQCDPGGRGGDPVTFERIWTCDLPRLRRYLPDRALEEL